MNGFENIFMNFKVLSVNIVKNMLYLNIITYRIYKNPGSDSATFGFEIRGDQYEF